ncbi:hypothetical protein KBD45_05330 [Candidatus Dojkabacteria bacterium]|nr:hypothetical protein [Candidatus Dojkabacteria bacterium]
MLKIFSIKTINSLISVNLFILFISGFGLSYSILSLNPTPKFNIINADPKILGMSTNGSCIDSDGLSLNKSIYIPGEVVFYKEQGNESYFKDHCIDEGKSLVEEFCEYDKNEKKTNIKSIVYICESGCVNGACIFKKD